MECLRKKSINFEPASWLYCGNYIPPAILDNIYLYRNTTSTLTPGYTCLRYLLPTILKVVLPLCPVPAELCAEQTYVPSTEAWAFKMVREGLDTVPPVKRAREPIFNVEVTPLIVLAHVMEETGGSAETMHTSSTAPPKFTLYELCAI